MKKFWNLMLAALVIIGAAACTENYDGVEKVQEAGLSFYAEIVNGTRATIEKDGDVWNTTWEGNETLLVKYADKTFTFVSKENEPGKFICNEEGVEELKGQVVTITAEGHNSLQGKNAFYTNTTTTFDVEKPIQLEAHTSFFRFTYNGEGNVVLTTEANAFIGANGEPTNTVTISGFGEHFVAFWPGVELTTPFTLAVNGETVREKELTLVAGKVYNLGTYEGTKNESFGIVGAHQGWNTEALGAMYLIPGSNTYVSRNVKLATGGFKIYGTTTKTVTIEHPATTTGETGDYYLVPNSNWKKEGARFAARFWYDSPFKEAWADLKDENGDGIYAGNYPDGFSAGSGCKVIFCRMNPKATANNWNNKWNQTGDLTTSTSKNCFTVPSGSWDGATSTWSVHTPEVKDAWTEVTEETTTYWFGKNDSDNISNWVTGYSDNPGGSDITVSDYSKLYDIYFSREADQDWGFVYYFTVRESGSAQPALK